MAKESDGSYREKYEALRRKHDSMVRGVELQDKHLQKMIGVIEHMRSQITRLQADLQSSEAAKHALAAEINNAGKADRKEILRLRAKLKSLDIPIED